jgi:hypothetical protein
MLALEDVELSSQVVLELPERELLGAIISISGHFEVSVLQHLLNDSFHDWHIRVLNDNSVSITVQDNLTQTQVNAFCTQATTVLSVQCAGAVT